MLLVTGVGFEPTHQSMSWTFTVFFGVTHLLTLLLTLIRASTNSATLSNNS